MTCQHALNRIIRLVQEHRTRAAAEHKNADTMNESELRGLDEWDATENDTALRGIESVVDTYCATTKDGRKRK